MNSYNDRPQKQKASIKKNYLFNLIYQLFLIIVPLIVTPYTSRVLLPDGIGKNAFANSLLTYFTIFANLGFAFYGQRLIAKNQNDKTAQSVAFWEIIFCRSIPTLVSLVANIAFCSFKIYGDYNALMWCNCINLLALGFDISFFFQGNEDFKKLVVRNVLIKSLSVAAVFLFVKKPSDLWIYALINSCNAFFSTLAMWVGIHKYIISWKGEKLRPFKHFKGALTLFVPAIAISIYLVLDRTLIGVMVPGTYTVVENGVEVVKKCADFENGIYNQSETLVKMFVTVVTSLGTVMISRNAQEYSQGNLGVVKENIIKSSQFVWALGVPIMLGLISIAGNFVPWFFGENYSKCILLIALFSPLVLIIGFSNILAHQYMVPIGLDKKYTIAVSSGAAINLLLNCIFIPIWQSLGAALATVIAEFFITSILFVMLRKEIEIKKMLSCSWKYWLSGVLMFAVVFPLSIYVFSPTILSIVLTTIIGATIYFLFLLLLKDDLVFNFLKMLQRKKNEKR